MASIKAKLAALRAKRASSHAAPKKVDADLLAAAAAVGSPRATWDTHLSERSYALSPDNADGTAVDSRSLSSDDESDCLVVLAPPVKQLHPAAQRQMWRMREAERARLKAAKDLAETGMAAFDEADETHVEGDVEQGDTADGEEGDVEEALLNRDEGDGSDDEKEDGAVAGNEENDQVVEGASKVEDDTACDKTEEKSDDVEGLVENQVEPDASEDKAMEEAGSKECSSEMDGRKRTLERLARLGGFVEDEAEDDDGGEGSVASGREGDDGKSCIVYDEDIASRGRDKKKLACFHREWEMGQEKTTLEGLTGGGVGDVDCAIDLAELEKRGDEVCVSEADEGEVNGERERAESYMDSMFLRDESRGAYGEDEDSGMEEIEKARALWKARQRVKSGETAFGGLEMLEEGVANRGRELRMKLEEMCRPNASGEGVRKRSRGAKRRRGISVGTWSLAAADEATSGVGSGGKNSVGCTFVRRRRKRAKGQVAAADGQRLEREKAGRANFNNILSILGERAHTD